MQYVPGVLSINNTRFRLNIPRKTQFVTTLMIAASMASIDRSIVNVSLPAMRADFGVEMNEIEWVVTAYMLSFLLVLPLMNWLKSRVGYYELMVVCLSVFTVGSALCSLAPNLPWLVASRCMQAAAGGILTPMTMAILSETLPKEEKGSAIAWWGIGNVTGLAIGPTLGGALSHYFGWPSVFYINLPLGIIALVMTLRHLSFLKHRTLQKNKFDFRGYVLFLGFILLVQLWVWMVAEYPLTDWKTWVTALAAAFFLVNYIRSSRKPDALLDLGVFRYALFNRSAIVIFIRSIALFGGMFYLPFLLQGEMGYSEMQTGLLMLPNALMVLVTRPGAGRLADKGRIRNVTLVGIFMVAFSFVLFAHVDADTKSWWILTIMFFRGIGMGLLVAPVSAALLNAVRRDQTATATTMNSLILQLGGSLGVAISGIFYHRLVVHYEKTLPLALAEHKALQGSFLIAAGMILIACIPASGLPVSNPDGGHRAVEKMQQ